MKHDKSTKIKVVKIKSKGLASKKGRRKPVIVYSEEEEKAIDKRQQSISSAIQMGQTIVGMVVGRYVMKLDLKDRKRIALCRVCYALYLALNYLLSFLLQMKIKNENDTTILPSPKSINPLNALGDLGGLGSMMNMLGGGSDGKIA